MEVAWFPKRLPWTWTTSLGIKDPEKHPDLRHHWAKDVFFLFTLCLTFHLYSAQPSSLANSGAATLTKHSPGHSPALSTHHCFLPHIIVLLPKHSRNSFTQDSLIQQFQSDYSWTNSPHFINHSININQMPTSCQTISYSWDMSVNKGTILCYKVCILVSCIHILHRLESFNKM